jgi:hypothetical protein
MERVRSDRGRRRLVARCLVGGLLGAALATVGFVGTAAADTIQFTGQGTNANGTCGSFEGQPPPPGGTQTWQFNLTGTNGPATMSATFSDGTTVTNQAEEQPHNGNVSKWLIVTDAGASVVSASATRPETGGNPQFVVSHCTAGGEPPPPTTAPTTTTPSTTTPSTTTPSGPEVGGVTAERPQAAVAVVAVPGFTG